MKKEGEIQRTKKEQKKKKRKNKAGEEYGMSVSIPLTPEAIWGYDKVTAAYNEEPGASWDRIFRQVKKLCPAAEDEEVIKVIGKRP